MKILNKSLALILGIGSLYSGLATATPTAISLNTLISGSAPTCGGSNGVQEYTVDTTGAGNKFTIEFFGATEQHEDVQSSGTWQSSFELDVASSGGYLKTAYLENGNLDVTLPTGQTGLTLYVYNNACGGAAHTGHFSLRVKPFTAKSVSLGGVIKDPASVPVEGATVSVYDSAMRWIGEGVTNFDGVYSVPLRPGLYYARVSKGESDVWLSGTPFPSASLIDIRDKRVSKNITLASARPAITNVSGSIAQGLPVTITGTGFGKSRGYLDFGGTVTSSSTLITSWTDTQIVVTAPTNARATCLRVFSKTGGYSDCAGGSAPALPTATITAISQSVSEGDAITYTLRLSAPSQYDALIKLNFSGTARSTDGKAADGTLLYKDYTKPALPITIPAGQTSATFTLTTIDDTLAESPETINVSLSSTGSGYVIGTTGKSASVSLLSDE